MKSLNRLSVKTLILSIVFTLISAFFIIQNNIKSANIVADFYANIVEQNIYSYIYMSETPETIFLSSPNGITQEQFDSSAKYISNIKPFLFLFVSPKQTVQYVYPSKDFSHMIGTNGFFSDKEARLSQIALSTNTTVQYVYNSTNAQDKWLIIKNPITKSAQIQAEEFLGFVTIGFSLNKFIDTIRLENIEKLGYNYQLKLIEDEQAILIERNKNYIDTLSTHRTIKIGGTEWFFSINTPWYKLVRPLSLILIFLSLRFFYYAYIYFRRKKISQKKQLSYELYVDSLTGVYNKKKLETLLNEKNAATLLYISLKGYDEFKEEYGKSFADGLLIAYSKRVKYNVKGGLVIHLGEEEFAVFLEGEMPIDAVYTVAKRIVDLSEQPFSIMGKTAHVSAKVGHSTLGTDSTKFTGLLNAAMERAKH